MRDDHPNSDAADHPHDDLLVERLTDSDSVGFSSDIVKAASIDEVPKTGSTRVFLQARYKEKKQSGYESV